MINKRSTELSSVVEKQAIFTGLKNDVKYTIKIRTMVNGRTLCQVKLEKEYVLLFCELDQCKNKKRYSLI